MKENILISACLLGEPTRYDGKSIVKIDLQKYKDKYNFVAVCPEVLGGLPTPRTPSERVGERVVMRDGTDVTGQFALGAARAVEICKRAGCKIAVLKAKSPSCGTGVIYDGTFSGKLAAGYGTAAEELLKNGITVIDENEFLEYVSRGINLSKPTKSDE